MFYSAFTIEDTRKWQSVMTFYIYWPFSATEVGEEDQRRPIALLQRCKTLIGQ